jgi:alpha-tubulin suppressor-like RCC1 family protein
LSSLLYVQSFNYLPVKEGKVWTWGNNGCGQLGNEYSSGKAPNPIPGMSNFLSVAAGEQFSMALDQNGSVWSWGRNSHGNLGLGSFDFKIITPVKIPTLINIRKISAGGSYGLALDSDMKVWSFGFNKYGSLGLGKLKQFCLP